ncbi:MAG: phosphoribosyltransferase family protein, partial [Acidimicrobiales bacterium]
VAMGAVGEGGVVVVDDATVRSAGVSPERFAAVLRDERAELERRVARYRPGSRAPSLAGAVVLVVDDGVATGATARAACRVARAQGAALVVLAVPVAATSAARELRGEADDVVVLVEARGAFAVGEWYDEFNQTTDDEVLACLAVAAARPDRGPEPGGAATS